MVQTCFLKKRWCKPRISISGTVSLSPAYTQHTHSQSYNTSEEIAYDSDVSRTLTRRPRGSIAYSTTQTVIFDILIYRYFVLKLVKSFMKLSYICWSCIPLILSTQLKICYIAITLYIEHVKWPREVLCMHTATWLIIQDVYKCLQKKSQNTLKGLLRHLLKRRVKHESKRFFEVFF
jgi:hypothetical protein